MQKRNLKWVVLVVAGILARFLFLGLRPLEGDEGIVIKMAQSQTLRGLLEAVSHDVHPPLFHFLEFITLRIWPLSEASSRIVSAIAGLVGIYFIFLVIKKLSNEKVAFWVSLLSIINPVLTYHFAEARPYGLLVALFFAQFYVFVQLIGSRKKRHIFGFFILSALMVLTQYISFVLLLGELLYLLLVKRKSATWAKIISGLGAVLVFAGLWGKVFLQQIQGRSVEQSQTLNLKANVMGLFNAVYRFFAGRLFLDLDPSVSKNLDFIKSDPIMFVVFVVSLIVPIGLLIWGLVSLYKNQKDNFLLMVVVFAPVILSAIASSEIGPRAARYLLFLVPFCLYIIVELFLSKCILFKKILFGVFIIIYFSAFTSSFYFERKEPGVNAIANYLDENANPGDQIVVRGGFGGGEKLALEYYLKNHNLIVTDLYGDYEVGNLDRLKTRDPWQYIKNIREVASGKNVWFYDMTYSFDEKTIEGDFQKYNLGKDKENKELVIYKF